MNEPRSEIWQEPSTESVPAPRPRVTDATWIAVYEKATGRLVSMGTVVAGKSFLEPQGFAAKMIGFNPQEPRADGGTYEWNEKSLTFDVVSLAEGYKRSAAALRAEADRLDQLAGEHAAAVQDV